MNLKTAAHSGAWGAIAAACAVGGAHLTAIAHFLPAKYQGAASAVAAALIAIAALNVTPPGKQK